MASRLIPINLGCRSDNTIQTNIGLLIDETLQPANSEKANSESIGCNKID